MKKILASIIVAMLVMSFSIPAYAASTTLEDSMSNTMPEDIQVVELDLDLQEESSFSETHPSEDQYNPYVPFYDVDRDIVGNQHHEGEYLHLYAAHGYSPVGYSGFFIDKNCDLNRLYIDWTGNFYVMKEDETFCVSYGEQYVVELISGETMKIFTEEVGMTSFGIPKFNVMVSRATTPVYLDDDTALGGSISIEPLFLYGVEL